MSKLLHTKAERTRLLKTFPSNSDGKDGDIVLCSISGRGIYICAKIDGRWFAANKMQDLNKVEKTSINELKTKKLSIKQLQDAGSDTDKFVVADAEGNLKYRTGTELISDIAMSLNDLSDVTYSSGDLTITSLDKIISGDLEIDSSGDIVLDADGGQVTIKDATASHFLFDCDATTLTIYDDTDAADLFSIIVSASGATKIRTVDDGAAVGHLTLQPDGDLILDPASQKTIINATDSLYFDGGGDTYIVESSSDNLRFVVGGVTMLDMTETANPSVNVNNSNITIDATKKLHFDGGIIGDTYIYESAADILDFYVGAKNLFKLDEANDRITLATGKLVAAIANGTEYSVANSAYAGMILGYTTVGIDATADSYTLTTSMVVTDSAHKVKFVAPPSGVVEISAQIYWDASRRAPVLGLSDNATYAAISFPNATDVTNEHVQAVPPSALGDSILRPHWVVTGLTPGTAYEWWLGAKTSLGTGGVLKWGGTATNEYPPFIMKAIALPAAVADYAVYG